MMFALPMLSLGARGVYATEIEKKFHVADKDRVIDQLERQTPLQKEIEQHDRYFDTQDLALYKSGAYTRVRQEKVAGLLKKQTLCHKRIVDGTYGNQYRTEEEHNIKDIQHAVCDLYEYGLEEKTSFKKLRKQYTWKHRGEPFAITIDTITLAQKAITLTYAEIEYTGATLSVDTALAYIDELARDLNIGPEEPNSNLTIALKYITEQ